MKDFDPQKQIEEILDTILKIASGQFLAKVPIYGENDNLDAIAQGINMLGEEIESRITTQIQNTKEIQELASKLEAITSSANDAILTMNPQANISYWNKAAELIFGYKEKEVLGKDLHQLIVPKRYHDQFLQGFRGFQENGQGVVIGKTVELVAKRQGGEEFPVALSLSSVRMEGEWNAIGIIRDITKAKQAENALRDANALKETLLDIITHDLKNPVGVISNLAEILLEQDSDNEMLEIIKYSSHRLVRVMDNATTLAQVSLGDQIQVEELDLTELIKSVVKEFNSQLKQSEMLLEIELPEKLYIQVNPIISAVFKNYISNAIKYATTGKMILIDSKEDNEFLTINVKDYGSTIPEEHRQKVFDRTHQIDDKKRGRGLGLSIVKRIADAHNAEIGVKPNEPTGNIFYIKIPTK